MKFGSLWVWRGGKVEKVRRDRIRGVTKLSDTSENHQCLLRQNSPHFYHCIFCGMGYTTHKFREE